MKVHANIDTADPSRIAVKTSYFQKDLIASVPGARYSHKDELWKLPLGWANCLALRSTFPNELEIGEELAKWAISEMDNRIRPAMQLREAIEADGSPHLYSYQRAGVAFMSVAQQALLADEMGTGKTRQAVMALQQIYLEGTNPFPCLAVVPNSTKIGWKREAAIVWPGLEVVVVKGSAAQRRKQLETPAHLYVMNWESVRGHSRLAPYGSLGLKRCKQCGGEDERITHVKCEVHPRELNQMLFASAICDEAHRMKDPKAKQTRAVWAATKTTQFRFALTGTPIADAPDDLWTILHWLSPGEWPARTKFIERMCEVSYNAFGAPTVIGIKPSMRDEFFAALDPRMRRMPKSVVLRFLPPIVPERRDVEMPPKQEKAYEQMRDLMLAELEGDILTTPNPLARVTRLLQFASSYATLETVTVKVPNKVDPETGGPVYRQEQRVKLADPSCKLDAFMDDIPDYGTDSVVVFAVSRQLIEMLSKRLEKRNIPHGLITGAQNADERQHHMDDFQAGRTKFILCTIAAGGVGITLTAARTAVFLQRSWSMIDNTQAEARIHRIGSEVHESIRMIDYVTAGTLEEVVIQAVEAKSQRLEEILRDQALLKKVIRDPEVKPPPLGKKDEAA